jgi:cysteine-rich repeat protein
LKGKTLSHKSGPYFGVAVLLTLIINLVGTPKAYAQACPTGKECTYIPALMPTPPMSMVTDPAQCSGTLLFAAPDIASYVDFSYKDRRITQFGINRGQVAFAYTPAGYNIVSGFNLAEQSGAMVVSGNGYVFTLQLQSCPTATYGAHIRNHINALGTRFRVAGFALDASNGDDTGFDYIGIYAPQATTVTATLPAKAYARLQSQSPAKRFWQQNAGPTVQVTLAEGESILLRTQGADPVVGARGFPIDGTLVTSEKPISLSVGGRGWAFDDRNNPVSADDAGDGVIPFAYLGTQYVVRSYQGTNAQQLRIVADNDGTQVRFNNTLVATLNAGDTYTAATPTGITTIDATAKVAVFQTAGLYGAHNDLALVTPAVFAPLEKVDIPIDIFTGDLATLFFIVPTTSVNSMTLNEMPIINRMDDTWDPVPLHPEWTALTINNLSSGRYLLEAPSDIVGAIAAGNDNPGHGTFVYVSKLRRPGCGDGLIADDEECDDGNIKDFDGCSSMCNQEQDYTCNGTPSVCHLKTAGVPETDEVMPDMPTTRAGCTLLGCPSQQWCSPLGCVPKRNNVASCTLAQQCLANYCDADGYCGKPAGKSCTDDKSCRSSACGDGYCLSLTAQAQGNGLFACSTTGHHEPLRRAEGAAVTLVAALILFARRWRRSGYSRLFFLIGVGILFTGLAPASALAQQSSGRAINVTGFDPCPLAVQQASGPWFSVDNFAPPLHVRDAHHLLNLRLSALTVHRPLVVRETDTKNVLAPIIRSQTKLRLTAAYWWRDRLRASITVPLQLWAVGDRAYASPVPYPAPTSKPAMGDIDASLVWVFWHFSQWPLRLALGASTTLPTGSTAAYAGDGTGNSAAHLGAAGERGAYDYTISAIRRLRVAGRKDDLARKPLSVSYRLGAGRYFKQKTFHLGLELTVSTISINNRPAFTKHGFWLEPMASVRYQMSRRWSWLAGGGTSLTQAPGAAPWRLFVVADFVPWSDAPKPDAGFAWTRPTPPSPSLPQPATQLQHTKPETAALAPMGIAKISEEPLPEMISFTLQSAELDPTGAKVLRNLAHGLKLEQQGYLLMVRGFTDNTGPATYNLALSAQRARVVREKLIQLGVPAQSVHDEGRGAQDFIAPNTTRPGRQKNRRVSFILKHPTL